MRQSRSDPVHTSFRPPASQYSRHGRLSGRRKQRNGKHYYLDDVSGAMLHDTITPDWHYVGSDGALLF